MKFIFKPLLFISFVINLSFPSHADTMDRAIFAYDEGDYETGNSKEDREIRSRWKVVKTFALAQS